MRIHVIIMTYNRTEMLRALLQDVVDKKGTHEVTVQVYDDCTPGEANTSVIRSFQKDLDIQYIRSPIWRGKRGYWRTIDMTFKFLPVADYYIYLPDDITLVNGFFDSVIKIWNAITDPRKACLNLSHDSRPHKTLWTPVKAKAHQSYLGTIWETGWVDMCFICSKRFFEVLQNRIEEIPESRWALTEQLSSGVGTQISQRLYNLKMTMWQVDKSMIIHDEHESQMHPWRKVPLVTINHAG